MRTMQYMAGGNLGYVAEQEHEVWTDLGEFVKAVKWEMIRNIEAVRLILEPGDGTRYEFMIAEFPRFVFVARMEPTPAWSTKLGNPPHPVPSWFSDRVREGEWTSHVICDFLRLLYQTTLPPMYDWKKAEPIYPEPAKEDGE